MPTPNLFTGMNDVHGPLEWVSLQDMALATAVCVRLARLWVRSAGDRWQVCRCASVELGADTHRSASTSTPATPPPATCHLHTCHLPPASPHAPLLKLAAVLTLWALSFILNEVALRTMGPAVVVAGRWSVTAVLVWLLLARRGQMDAFGAALRVDGGTSSCCRCSA